MFKTGEHRSPQRSKPQTVLQAAFPRRCGGARTGQLGLSSRLLGTMITPSMTTMTRFPLPSQFPPHLSNLQKSASSVGTTSSLRKFVAAVTHILIFKGRRLCRQQTAVAQHALARMSQRSSTQSHNVSGVMLHVSDPSRRRAPICWAAFGAPLRGSSTA